MAVRAPLGLLSTAAALSWSACCADSGARLGVVTETRTVEITNRSGEPLGLCRACRDGFDAPIALGEREHTTLHLLPGRYALRLGDGDRGVPVPLPAPELGFAPPHVTTVTVWPWPAARAGWCWIPAGIGLRGDDLGIGQEDERPVDTPESPGFWLATHETTNAQFVQFLNALPPNDVAPDWLDLGGPKCRIRRDAAANAFTTDAPDLPVVTVAWNGAAAYCRWLTATSGAIHRLPTETEWEKAARGDGSRVYSYGDTYRTGAANQESGELRAVGSFPAGGFGLHDMTGNAFEWTGDVFRRNAYGGVHPAGAEDSEHRALRGGSFVLDGIFVRNSMRMRLRPDVRADDVGFRVLRENDDPRFGPAPGK